VGGSWSAAGYAAAAAGPIRRILVEAVRAEGVFVGDRHTAQIVGEPSKPSKSINTT
jgi:hypothetical protein